jgi:integrase
MPPLHEHLAKVKRIHQDVWCTGRGNVSLPEALARKSPKAAREWNGQYVFPARGFSTGSRSGALRRPHLDEATINKAIKVAVERLGIVKRVSSHTIRHCFATCWPVRRIGDKMLPIATRRVNGSPSPRGIRRE